MEKRKKPNIIFILSDDQGAWAMGCSGNHEIRTPNLDRLASTGVRFENFFCASPVCSPARASLLTGRIPSQHGVLDWIVGGNGPGDWKEIGGTGESVEYLKGQTGYTDILAEHGYFCGISGKWHLGYSFKPQKSFKHWFAWENAGGSYIDPTMIKDGKEEKFEGYLTDIITDNALEFLEGHAGDENPFYLSIHHYAPHAPWIDNHPKEIVDSYAHCEFASCRQEPCHPWAARGVDDARESLKGYFAAVTAMDLNIGRVIDKLEELGIREDTLVVFVSDNGFNCGHHGIWGKGNGTFPQNMYDTSVKVPCIFSQPGTIPEGKVCEALVSAYDFMPTLLDYLGFENQEAGKLPGRSFLNIMMGQAGEERDSLVVFDEYGPVRMIRTKEWKYIHRYPYGPHELYHLPTDPDERRNLIDEGDCAEIIVAMRNRLENWFIKYVNPDLDGTKKAVLGNGQRDLAGIEGKLKEPFYHKIPFHYTRIKKDEE